MTNNLSERRALLGQVRTLIRCHYYEGYIIGLTWNPGKSDDKEYGNVTAYLSKGTVSGVLPFRKVLSANYEQEIADLVHSCKSYVDKEIALENALDNLKNHDW